LSLEQKIPLPLFEIALVAVRFDHNRQCHRKRESLALDDAICGGENVGDAFPQVEGLVMVSGSESA
jgi:hypothetical protein